MDKIFKIGLLVLGFGYLTYLLCPITNQAGRYRYHYEHLEDKDSVSVFDTSRGLLYSYASGDGFTRLDLIKMVKDDIREKKALENKK